MPLNLLLIDDDAASRELLQSILAQEDVTLLTETDPESSARRINQQRFEGIFLNFGSSGVDAEGLSRKIRRSANNRTTPIMMLARKGDQEVLRRGFEAGATFFLPTPVTRREVQEVLRKSRGTMMDERRRHQRIRFTASFNCLFGERVIAGRALDLSESGMAVELENPVTSGAHLRCHFQLPPARTIEVDVVVRTGDESRAGVEFTRISSDDRQAIQDHVKAALQGG